MAMVRCPAGEHDYDDTRHSSCPYCTKIINKGIRMQNRDTDDKTVIYKQNRSNTVNPDDSNKTIAPWMESTGQSMQNAPVTGWLVIIEGEGKGRDYRLIPGINSIGRDNTNTIVIDFDKTISREKHCIIEFDYKSKKFYIEKDANSVYLNDERVAGNGKELTSNDIVEIGKTKLKFIPFCNSDFCWEL